MLISPVGAVLFCADRWTWWSHIHFLRFCEYA